MNVIPSLQDGGIESLIYRISKGLNKDKYDLYICCLANIENNYSYKRFVDIGCNVTTYNFVNTNLRFQHIFTNGFQLLKFILYLSRNRFHVVHSQDFFSAAVTRIALLLSLFFFYKPKRNYVTLHNMQFWLKNLHRKLNKILSYSTDNIICISQSVYNFSLANDKIAKKKYIIIYNGIDTDVFYPQKEYANSVKKELNLAENIYLIGNVATFSVRKGHKYLLKAFSMISSTYPNAHLAIVGGKRSHEMDIYHEMLNIIEQNNIKDKVHFLEPRDNIQKFYNGLNLYVMPSIVEGFGLALAEAMACEKVVIASDIPPFREILNDKTNGYLFESKNPESLAFVLNEVMKNAESQNEITVNARKVIVEKFSEGSMLAGYDNIYSINVN